MKMYRTGEMLYYCVNQAGEPTIARVEVKRETDTLIKILLLRRIVGLTPVPLGSFVKAKMEGHLERTLAAALEWAEKVEHVSWTNAKGQHDRVAGQIIEARKWNPS